MVPTPSHLVGLHDNQRVAVSAGTTIHILDISTGNGVADRQFVLVGTIIDLAKAYGGNHIAAVFSNKLALLDWTTGTTPIWTDTLAKTIASVVAIP